MHPTRLREIRESAGLSQAALSQEIGVSPSTISNAESGRRQLSQTVLSAWLKACGQTTIVVPLGFGKLIKTLDGIEYDLLIRLAVLLPNLHEMRRQDLEALIECWEMSR